MNFKYNNQETVIIVSPSKCTSYLISIILSISALRADGDEGKAPVYT